MTLSEQVQLQEEVDELRKALDRVTRQLRKKEAVTERLVNAVYQAAQDTHRSQPAIPKPVKAVIRAGQTPHAALLHTTDWQCGKATKDFNSTILGERLHLMMDKAAILSNRHGNPTTIGHILLGGDMIEGITIFPTQPWEVDSGLFIQLFTVVRYIQTIIDKALTIWPQVHITSKWGNHGRIGKFGDIPDIDNLDRMAYHMAAERYRNEPRVTWDSLNTDYVQQVHIGNYHAALLHGNEFNRTASAQRIVTKLTAWQTLHGFGDTYIGHFHRRDCYGLPNGTMAYLTGSPESSNSYAADQLAAQSNPSQRLHFVDPVEGRVVAEHILWLN